MRDGRPGRHSRSPPPGVPRPGCGAGRMTVPSSTGTVKSVLPHTLVEALLGGGEHCDVRAAVARFARPCPRVPPSTSCDLFSRRAAGPANCSSTTLGARRYRPEPAWRLRQRALAAGRRPATPARRASTSTSLAAARPAAFETVGRPIAGELRSRRRTRQGGDPRGYRKLRGASPDRRVSVAYERGLLR